MSLAAPKTDMSFTAKPLSILFVPTRKLYESHTQKNNMPHCSSSMPKEWIFAQILALSFSRIWLSRTVVYLTA